MRTCYIIGAGHFGEDKIDLKDNDYVIAADGGYNYALKLNIRPDIVIGDFDSLKEIPQDIPYEQFPVKKDDTDMMLAVKKAISLGFTRLVLFGALGGERIDHTLANIALLKYGAKQNVEVIIKDETRRMFALRDGKVTIKGQPEGYISVFAFDEKCQGVSIKGLKYEVKDICLSNSVPLGVSNEFVGKDAVIEVTKGTLLITYDKK